MTRTPWCFGAALFATFTAQAAAAQALPEITLQGCESFSLEALRKHLGLELATLGLSGDSPGLTLRCSGSAVLITLTPEPGKPSEAASRVELGDTAPGARERLVALAATELLAQSERRLPDRIERPPSLPPPPEQQSKQGAGVGAKGRAQRRRLELFLAGATTVSGKPQATLFGGALGSRVPIGARWSVWLDSRVERGEEALELATVRWLSGSLFVGGGATARVGALKLSSALGTRAGWVSLSASAEAPNQGQSLTAPWIGAALPLHASLRLGESVEPFVGVEVGYVALPVRGVVSDGEPLIEHSGAWLSASLGVALQL